MMSNRQPVRDVPRSTKRKPSWFNNEVVVGLGWAVFFGLVYVLAIGSPARAVVQDPLVSGLLASAVFGGLGYAAVGIGRIWGVKAGKQLGREGLSKELHDQILAPLSNIDQIIGRLGGSIDREKEKELGSVSDNAILAKSLLEIRDGLIKKSPDSKDLARVLNGVFDEISLALEFEMRSRGIHETRKYGVINRENFPVRQDHNFADSPPRPIQLSAALDVLKSIWPSTRADLARVLLSDFAYLSSLEPVTTELIKESNSLRKNLQNYTTEATEEEANRLRNDT